MDLANLDTPPDKTAHHSYHRGLLPFLAVVCGIGVASNYYNQPLLLEIGRTFGKISAHTGLVAVATQIGYAGGLFFFVPLGDVVERRGLMMKMFGGVAAALTLAAFAPSLAWLGVASIAVGLMAAVTHIALPIAPDVAEDKDRGHAIGTVMTGLLLGILLARTFAGWLSALVGWRGVYLIAAVANAAFIPLVYRMLPRLAPKTRTRYVDALRSLWTLFRSQPDLRESSLIGALIMAAFTAFWTTLVFLLGSNRYHMGAGVAGSFGILGATGAFIAPVAGRLSDQHGPRYVIGLALTTIAFSFVVVWAGGYSMIALVLGVILLDLGVQANQISNQTRIFGLMPEARSRINTVYMTAYFAGAALGSLFGTIAWARWQWTGVCGFGLLATALAGLRHANPMRRFAARRAGLEHGSG